MIRPQSNQKGAIPLLLLIATVGVIGFLLFSSLAPFKDHLFSIFYPKPPSHAAGSSVVKVVDGKLYVDNQLFIIKGINYNPIPISSDQIDSSAPNSDVPKIAEMGASTIATYNSSKFEWDTWSDAGNADVFYTNLAQVAESKNLKIIIGYFSNQSINWTDSARVAKVTAQYQNLVLKAKDRPSTLMYMIGNETFEKMSNDTQRLAYAKWIGQMIDWTHVNDPKHPITYTDNDQRVALNWLKTYAPNLDIYSYNNYVWGSVTELKQALQIVQTSWSDKPILLHEWGVDSFDVPIGKENYLSQTNRFDQLLPMVDQVYSDSSIPLIGQVVFEYTDEWHKLGTPSSQTPDSGWSWGCKTPFDSKCNEEYWGLTTAANPDAASIRTLKPAYYALQKYWSNNPSPSPVTSTTPQPSTVSELTSPTVSITSPSNSTTISRNTNFTISANASDNVGVAKVEFLVNGSLKCSDTSSPYSCITKVGGKPGASHTLTAKAYDKSGNSAVSSVSVKTP